MKANIFSICFPFMGKFYYTKVDANAIAMDVACDIMGDGMLDAACEHNQLLEYRFEGPDGDKYMAGFSYDNVGLLNVFKYDGDPESDDYDEMIVEKDIPYTIIKVENDKKELYNLSECI